MHVRGTGEGGVTVKTAALFSGKDSLYAAYLAEGLGLEVNDLITMITTLGEPSPHLENIEAMKKAAERMRKRLRIVDLRGGEGELLGALRITGASGLVAGDVFVEDHIKWLEGICRRAGIGLVEPLYRRGTLELLKEMLRAGFVVKIIGVDTRLLGEDWLGFTLSEDTLDEFLAGIGKADPLGENGEYHTLVLDCPLYTRRLDVRSSWEVVAGPLKCLRVEVS
ncbi:MAG: ATP pyrophosphatase [Candidatus Verstraetearchaeota archaeon]|nr:ATP pyrophosphatase [Candidatus Verstraetearchaeota archaeon]